MTKRVRAPIAIFAALALGAASFACGEDCRDLDGSWTISQHCQSDFVDRAAVIQQDGCDITSDVPWPGFGGQVNADGTVSFGGVIDASEVINCTGTTTDSQITLTCDDCAVVLRR